MASLMASASFCASARMALLRWDKDLSVQPSKSRSRSPKLIWEARYKCKTG